MRSRRIALLLFVGSCGMIPLPSSQLLAQEAPPPVSVVDPAAEAFEVTYVAVDALYLDGGSDAGLEEGVRLTVRRRPAGASLGEGAFVAEIVVFAVTRNSAACEIESAALPVMEGDVAYIVADDRAALEERHAAEPPTLYAQVVSFTAADPLEQEIRESRPQAPLPEVNRFRGRIGFEHGSIHDRTGTAGTNLQEGLYLRADMTRIGGSHWNLTGYWRGRLNSRSPDPQQETLTDLTNRVYHIGLYYNDPGSRWVAGFGRLLVPWASSLSTLDGGYFGRRLGRSWTAGAFAGSTPDPTAWNYDPDRQMFGGFVNFDGGSFETVRHATTAGVALTRLGGVSERQFLFVENSLHFGSQVDVFHNLEADRNSRGRFATSAGTVLSRSFLTLRFRPTDQVALDLNHNYFRVVPTFDPRLGGGGLVDDLLFQGLSGGVQVSPYTGLTLYARLGRSERDDDASRSLNQMYGVTWSRLPGGLRADIRYSLFDGAFGSGTYESASLIYSREDLRAEVQVGNQKFQSGVGPRTTGRYVNGSVDWFVGRQVIVGGGTSVYRGNSQRYDQVFFSFGYVFGSRRTEG